MKAVCTVEACERQNHARGWCKMHYKRWWLHGTTDLLSYPRSRDVNPLVCICPEPVADLSVDAGMCQLCKRKPLNLMAVTT